MSVLIKGLHKPDENHRCPFVDAEYGYCLVDLGITGRGEKCEYMKDCPLIELPDHGRLIDADALTDYARHTIIRPSDEFASVVINLFGLIESLATNAPTIIEADRSDE